ncbi:hypothetical protein MPH_06922 [Macrophomina phaseolina MS6]|uniref:Uncharacterized protein n=1 Tax=Macrophomina phaseolina (strain MS6) TaxID=1126212 RepID=K2R169_MACPH|nr:hypothetical protein MPH_06922 [Macrophomina phaseolina MS6]
MSDFEGDEMEVDAPAIEFSASNMAAKGKRSAANLPVEAEDTLPWVEKYRPDTLDDVSGHQDILATINKFVDSNQLIGYSDSRTSSSTAPPVPARPPPYSRWHAASTATRTCARWSSSSTPATIEALTSSGAPPALRSPPSPHTH